jgi:hypothetical protein
MIETATIVFLTKVPVYIYVIYKAWTFRHSLLIVSANWLGCLAFFGAMASLSVLRTHKVATGIIAYGVVLSLFMLTYTAKELKKVERKK